MKTAIIMIGLPGSGKSTYAKNIIIANPDCSSSYHSTDDFFMVDGKYCWSAALLGPYHMRNVSDFKQSCEVGTNIVICDNTNLKTADRKKYIKIAEDAGYNVMCIQMHGKVTEEQIDLFAARNSHGVSRAIISSMAAAQAVL